MYVLHACGVLFSRCDVDRFEHYGERALIQLRQLLQHEGLLTQRQLVMLVTAVMFTVHQTYKQQHTSGVTQSEFAVIFNRVCPSVSNVVSVQHAAAVRFALCVWAILLDAVLVVLNDVQALPLLTAMLSAPDWTESRSNQRVQQLLRVLPALALFSEWISRPHCYSMFCNMSLNAQSFGDSLRVRLSVWHSLADVCNHLVRMETRGQLCKLDTGEPKRGDTKPVLTPEMLMSASFAEWMDVEPAVMHVQRQRKDAPQMTNVSIRTPCLSHQAQYALHARLDTVHNSALFFDGYHSLPEHRATAKHRCIRFDHQQKRFVACVERADSADEKKKKRTGRTKQPSTSRSQSPPEQQQAALKRTGASGDETESDDSDLPPLLSESGVDEPMRAVQISEKKTVPISKHLLRISPKVLVPDTNVLIDHLADVVSLVGTRLFEVCVPTVVAVELAGLSRLGDQGEAVRMQALEAVKVLRREVADARLYLTTTKGEQMRKWVTNEAAADGIMVGDFV